jgi:hypothetical protein
MAAALLARAGRTKPPSANGEAWPEAAHRVGALDRLWVAIASGDLDAAETEARGFVAWHRASGSWFPDDWCPDELNPSAVEGLMALAAAFLRLAHRDMGPRLGRLAL